MTLPSLLSLATVVQGWVFAGRRTLTGVLVAAADSTSKHFSAYYRLFATARWSLDQVGLALVRLALPLLGEGPVPLDDTLARKRGLKVFGAGMHHDPLASSRRYAVTSWGHSWVGLAVRVQVPCCPGRFFSLPVLFRLSLNQKAAARWHLKYRTRPEWAVELLQCLCTALTEYRFRVAADSTYGGQSVLGHLPDNCDLLSRLPLDARLFAPPPAHKPGTQGRPRKRGMRLPSPRQMLAQQRARRVTLHLYGRQDTVRLVETVSAEQVLAEYAGRWSIEEAFQGSKSHLGFEEPQGWSRLAVRRTAPLAMLLYSLTVLWFAQHGHRLYTPVARPWYRHKVRPSFADMLATLRLACLKPALSATPASHQGRQNLLVLLPDTLQVAAAGAS
ncbi:transposase [Stigmatella aurantiaca]|nr:transposase [Stigmatella aurantiaca]EAU66557.1 hypothetical protein STIAU_3446 [Stigmatella aurantiaca DW4/3-1]